jgi:hypothetical protein
MRFALAEDDPGWRLPIASDTTISPAAWKVSHPKRVPSHGDTVAPFPVLGFNWQAQKSFLVDEVTSVMFINSSRSVIAS